MSLRLLPLLIAAALATALPAAARTLKIATVSPDGTAWMKEMRAGGREIAERTEGRVKLKFYPGGVMGSERSVLRKLRVGQLHGGAFSAGGLVEVYNDMQVYSVPFLFHSFEEVDYVRERMDALLAKGLEERGLVVLGLGESGFARIFSVKPLENVEQLSGRKMWIPEGDTMSQLVLEAGGVSPVPLPISDVYTGLQTGLVDTVAVPPIGAIAFQWHTKVKYLVDVPLMYVLGVLAVDQKTFGKLSEPDQAVVREVMKRVFADLDQMSRSDNLSAKQALESQSVSIVEPPPTEVERWRAITEQVLDEYVRRDLYTQEMYDTLVGHLRDYRKPPPVALGP